MKNQQMKCHLSLAYAYGVISLIFLISLLSYVQYTRFSSNVSLPGAGPTGPIDIDEYTPMFKDERLRHQHTESNETLSLCIPCLAFNDVMMMTTMLKSILLNTNSRMTLYFVTTKSVRRTLETLFQTWEIAQVNMVFYDEIPQAEASKMTIADYFDRELVKILPKVLYMNPKLFFTTNIYGVWKLCETLHRSVVMVNPERFETVALDTVDMQLVWRGCKDELNSTCPTQEMKRARVVRGIFHQADRNFMSFPMNQLDIIEELNGDVFRQDPPKRSKIGEPCFQLRHSVTVLRRIHLCFHCRDVTTDNVDVDALARDVTATIHSAYDGVSTLPRALESWTGPTSIVLYLSDIEARRVVLMLKRQQLPERSNIKYHVVYMRGRYYPINFLRNLAIREADTHHVVLMDVDFVTVSKMHSTLKQILPIDNDTVGIVPAFETHLHTYGVPPKKSFLQGDFKDGKARVFQETIFPDGHRPLDYEKWFNTSKMYEVPYRRYYDPFMLIHKGAPPFDERLLDRMQSKSMYVKELHMAGYRIMALPNVYMLHMPHSPIQRSLWNLNNTEPFKRCVRMELEMVEARLRLNYPNYSPPILTKMGYPPSQIRTDEDGEKQKAVKTPNISRGAKRALEESKRRAKDEQMPHMPGWSP